MLFFPLLQLQDALTQKGAETESFTEKVARLEQELSNAVQERESKLSELKAAISAQAASGISDEELLQRIGALRKQK